MLHLEVESTTNRPEPVDGVLIPALPDKRHKRKNNCQRVQKCLNHISCIQLAPLLFQRGCAANLHRSIYGKLHRLSEGPCNQPESEASEEPPIRKTIEVEIRDCPEERDVQHGQHER